jgi:hypothetical protein
MPLTLLGSLFVAGVLAHNAEEALRLPTWSAAAGRWHPPVQPSVFRFAIVAFSILLVVCAIAACVQGQGTLSAYLFTGCTLAMVLNVFLPHVAATIAMRRYMPGTATALLLNLPLGSRFLYRALTERFVHGGTFVWAGPVVVLGVLALIPVLFAIGRRFARRAGEPPPA